MPLAFTPSGVLNMLSFFATFPIFPFVEKSCHLLLPASSSFPAFTFRGTLAGRGGPSLTLLGSCLAWLASAGSTFAAADMTFVFDGGFESEDARGIPSALRFLESPDMGLISFAERVSVVA